jgi:hypothetical protein
LVAIQVILAIPACLWLLIIFQTPVIISIPSEWAIIPEVAGFSTTPTTGLSCGPSLRGGSLVLPVIFVLSGGYQYSLQF